MESLEEEEDFLYVIYERYTFLWSLDYALVHFVLIFG